MSEETVTPVTGKAMTVVLVYSFTVMFNGFMYMDYTGLESLCETWFGVSSTMIGLAYSLPFLVAGFCMPVAAWFIVNYEFATLTTSIIANAIGAWFRYYGLVTAEYSWVMVSTPFVGIGTSVMIVSFASIPESWLPQRWQLFGTTYICEVSYFGWGLGCLIPFVASTIAELETVLLAQFIFGLVLIGTIPMLRQWPCCPGLLMGGVTEDELALTEESAGGHGAVSLEELATLDLPPLASKYAVRMVVFSLLNGVAWSIPDVTDSVLDACCDASSVYLAVVSFVFIGFGIATGIYVSLYCEDLNPTVLLRRFFACSTLCFISAALCAALWNTDTNLFGVLLLIAEAGAGAASLGFIGIALTEASLPGVPTAYTAGFIEWATMFIATLVCDCGAGWWGLLMCAVIAVACSAAYWAVCEDAEESATTALGLVDILPGVTARAAPKPVTLPPETGPEDDAGSSKTKEPEHIDT